MKKVLRGLLSAVVSAALLLSPVFTLDADAAGRGGGGGGRGGGSRAAGGGFKGSGTGGFGGFKSSGTAGKKTHVTNITTVKGKAGSYQKATHSKPPGAHNTHGGHAHAPGSKEHKAARWSEYQARGGKWHQSRWEKQYHANINNQKTGSTREASYRKAWGGHASVMDTPHGPRHVDVRIPQANGKDRVVEIKTGYQSLTTHGKLPNTFAIMRDRQLVMQGHKVEWVLEKGGSKEMIKALNNAGIKVHIGSQIK